LRNAERLSPVEAALAEYLQYRSEAAWVVEAADRTKTKPGKLSSLRV
jgi:hypothetical protein